ncbi:hypothetical protein PSA7680_00672 [Pseudoruegeria aquimaris]|uniref:Histidine phosphotransferase ChpT C-terminal domain-containing protein n=1 Tax=Pseudoruegeria aquimaris TaxID=393663 RepID=A0A1Y5RNB8_9RHOB|nr:histidine phosphotransferase family protein [Pseudoruegeria aquimaris]SLN18905.1 hypothetical protein PSA7680_00672 [Pseudoruegeria aquimaris]
MPERLTDDLAGLVGARICHDVINPLGAIGNGLELLLLTLDAPAPEVELLEASVRNAQSRVKFLRIAFGPARDSAPVAAPEIRAIIEGFTTGSRHEIAWRIDEDLARKHLRRAFLMLLCLLPALPRGGRLVADSDGRSLALTATGPRVLREPDLWEPMLAGRRPEAPSAATVQFALLADDIATEGLSPEVEEAEERLLFRL